MMKPVVILIVIFVVILLPGCAPDYPNNSEHTSASNDDCISCYLNLARGIELKRDKVHQQWMSGGVFR